MPVERRSHVKVDGDGEERASRAKRDRRVKGEAVPTTAARSSHAKDNGGDDELASRATRGRDSDEHASRAHLTRA